MPVHLDRPAARVVRLRLDNPGRRNVPDAALGAALRDAVAGLGRDRSARPWAPSTSSNASSARP